ncbi:MAG: symmetrical bis(5'-nucleosyl)-tetraphosphatase [Gammaproteobacteria bacterium]|nr:symmetrical bis(5'-nucleosyl)-tetraphosphatase [Gammaproteobacteria bacterium]
MAVFAIGDVQGCYEELARLLAVLEADPSTDELWFVGDLVNRGPQSLEVLRLVRSLGRAAIVVLGNHDLHLLALGLAGQARVSGDALRAVLAAPDRDELLDWLRRRPLAHYRPDLNTLMVHAGVARDWDPLLTVKLAREVERVLRGDDAVAFLRDMYGNEPDAWSGALAGTPRLRFIVNCLTRIRYCHADGALDFTGNGPPGSQAAGLVPWFELPGRAAQAVRIVFGHWSALGFLQRANLLGLDTGCVWGRSLTAVRLDGPARVYAVPARGGRVPAAD